MEAHVSELVVNTVRELAGNYLEGGLRPIEAALELEGFRDALPSVSASIFDTFLVISSETDDILLGDRRALWHPDVRAAEDAKHDQAQEWARPLMDEACALLLSALPKAPADPAIGG
jgi:hypothetical protein